MSLEAGLKGVGGIAQQQREVEQYFSGSQQTLAPSSSTSPIHIRSPTPHSLYNSYSSPQLSGEIDDIDDDRTSSAGSGLAILKTPLRIGSSVSLFIEA